VATLEQLEAEAWWGREIVTSPMVGLGLQLRATYNSGSGSVGIKGNEVHLSGGHRSQEWIRNSRYCTNRTYTVQSNLAGDQFRYISALDFTPAEWGSTDNRNKMKVLTDRMLDAMKSGHCEEVIECFGTLDGRNVTGWRNDLNQVATSDNSHLDHIHVRFDRRYCNSNAVMQRVAGILLGGDMALTADDANVVWYTKNLPSGTPTLTPATALLDAFNDGNANRQTLEQGVLPRLTAVETKLEEILTALQNLTPGAGGADAGTFTGEVSGTWTRTA
jgi:hypothetical protein